MKEKKQGFWPCFTVWMEFRLPQKSSAHSFDSQHRNAQQHHRRRGVVNCRNTALCILSKGRELNHRFPSLRISSNLVEIKVHCVARRKSADIHVEILIEHGSG